MNENHQRPPWIIRTYAGFGDAQSSNRRYLENIRNGQTGLSVAFDLPTQNGYDPDAPMARGEVGGCGVSIAHLGDMETLLAGIDLSAVNTSMTINATAPFLLALYLVLAERKAVSWERLRGTVQNDLLKEFVARGTNIFSPEVSLRLSTDLITFASENIHQWNPINVCGYHYMESGAEPHQEIGYAIGNALIILDSIRPSLNKDLFETVVKRISFFINSGIELVPELCKIRAYSRLWTDLCKSRYDIDGVRFRAGCQVRSLSLTAAQPENNIVRIALEALPALLSTNARVQALQLPGFREALSLPDEMEQTLSLRTQQILMHETKITDFADIFAGNPVIEELTTKTMERARSIALNLHSVGYEKTIECLYVDLTKALLERHRQIESGKDIVVGVNKFKEAVGLSEQLSSPPPTAQDEKFEEERIRNVVRWRANRDPITMRVARERLEAAVRNGKNIMPPTIELARAGGTVGEWTSIIELATTGRYNVRLNLQAVSTLTPSRVLRDIRIVLGKAGLDGHTNAIKLLAIACRNAGMEVIFSGIKLSPAALIKAAIEEDADILGVSCLSGAHLKVAEDILTLKAKLELSTLKLVIGGIIPEVDKRSLMDMGIDLVITNRNNSFEDIVGQVAMLVSL